MMGEEEMIGKEKAMERKQSVRKYLVVTVLALIILAQALAFCFVIFSPPVYGDTYVAALSD